MSNGDFKVHWTEIPTLFIFIKHDKSAIWGRISTPMHLMLIDADTDILINFRDRSDTDRELGINFGP